MARRFEKAKEYTEKYKSVLLPCRICGNKNIVIASDRSIFPPKDVWNVCCSTYACDCVCGYTSVKEAVKQWNEMQSKGEIKV